MESPFEPSLRCVCVVSGAGGQEIGNAVPSENK